MDLLMGMLAMLKAEEKLLQFDCRSPKLLQPQCLSLHPIPSITAPIIIVLSYK